MVQTLLWSDEVRQAAFPALDETVKVTAKELDLSKQLVESLVAEFKPDEYVDEYQQELRTLIAAKLDQGDALDTAATFGEQPDEEGGEVIDLMEALRRSIASKRGGADVPADDSSTATAKTAKGGSTSSSKAGSKKAASSKTGKPAKSEKSEKPKTRKAAAS